MTIRKVFSLYLVFTILITHRNDVLAQDAEAHMIKDAKTGCAVLIKHGFPEDSISWDGGCKNGLATGLGKMVGFSKGYLSSMYNGEMNLGKPNGKGLLILGNDRKLEGNFLNGEPLFLKDVQLKYLNKIIISKTDSLEIYVGDNNQKELYYHAIVPEGKIIGALVLLPGTWESTEHLLSSTQALCELAYAQHLAVIALSINQRLTLTNEIVNIMNSMIGDAIKRYHIPQEHFVIGGWSMGGLFSLRYTELANQDASKTIIKPAAVFSCDGPSDLLNIYDMFESKLKKNPNNGEAAYGIKELVSYCGGKPIEAKEKYIYYSCYSHSLDDGGNAKYLINTPVRIYNDLDANWWMKNRGIDMYYMNGLDQTAMIQLLNDRGNQKAEFINSYQKGYRLEGNRHPHSWSIVEPNDCIKWVMEIFNK